MDRQIWLPRPSSNTASRPASSAPFRVDRAEFAALGGLHRNTFLDAPQLARRHLRPARAAARLRFAGQITACAGLRRNGPGSDLLGRPLRGGRAGWAEPTATQPADPRRTAPSIPYTGGHVATIDAGGRFLSADENANFGLLPRAHVRAKGETGQRLAAPQRCWPKSRRSPAGARRSRALARRRRPRRAAE